MAKIKLKVDTKNDPFFLGTFEGTRDTIYEDISFSMKARSVFQSHWKNTHDLSKLRAHIVNRNKAFVYNVFHINYCTDNRVLEIHVATAFKPTSVLEEYLDIIFPMPQASVHLIDLEPVHTQSDGTIESNPVQVEFLVYTYTANGNDSTFKLCKKGPDNNIPVYKSQLEKVHDLDLLKEYRINGLQPDIKKGNVIVGKN